MPFLGKHNNQDYSDEKLITHYQSEGDPAYIGILFERYTEWVFLSCMKYLKDEVESEEVTMQIFEKLIHDLKRYQIGNFQPWLGVVVRNFCLAYLRKRRQKHEINQSLKDSIDIYDSANHVRTEKEDQEQKLRSLEKAIKQLNDSQHTCLRLFYFEQKSYKEISVATGYTFKQVKSHIQNGKRNLKNILKNYYGEI